MKNSGQKAKHAYYLTQIYHDFISQGQEYFAALVRVKSRDQVSS